MLWTKKKAQVTLVISFSHLWNVYVQPSPTNNGESVEEMWKGLLLAQFSNLKLNWKKKPSGMTGTFLATT